MEDPCKECWPRVDPYDCWGCPNIEKHHEYIRETLNGPCEAKDIYDKNTEEE